MEVKQERKPWSLTAEALDKLLLSLDPDRERAGEKYERIRGGLVCFFEWRGAPFPDDHADETINRVARKIGDGDQVSDPFTYVYGVARLVLLEVYKSREKERAALARLPQPTESSQSTSQREDQERQLDCLERCIAELPRNSRDLLTTYYDGEKRAKIQNRQKIADRLRIPLNALRLRARRIREKLEVCVDGCVTRGAGR